MATLTTLFAKIALTLQAVAFSSTHNRYITSPFPYVVAGITVLTAIGQVFWINQGLRRYDALLQVPVFYVVWLCMDVVGGAVYFDEFRGMAPRQIGLFSLGLWTILAGVFVLAQRLNASPM
jgi:hypothetical protein